MWIEIPGSTRYYNEKSQQRDYFMHNNSTNQKYSEIPVFQFQSAPAVFPTKLVFGSFLSQYQTPNHCDR